MEKTMETEMGRYVYRRDHMDSDARVLLGSLNKTRKHKKQMKTGAKILRRIAYKKPKGTALHC